MIVLNVPFRGWQIKFFGCTDSNIKKTVNREEQNGNIKVFKNNSHNVYDVYDLYYVYDV